MQNGLKIDVATLDLPHRRALEEVIGRGLSDDQQLLISVIETRASQTGLPAQTLEEWTSVYDGLTDDQIDSIDRITKTRANVTRDLP
jgi:hypothetical protein